MNGDTVDRVGIVAALAAEARALGAARRGADGLASLADGSLVGVSGMGFEAAARAAERLAQAGCGALMSSGFAGGLDPALAAGTVVVPYTILFEGAPALDAAAAWRERLVRSLSGTLPTPIASGRTLTCLQPRTSVSGKREAFRRTGAVAVDTESYAVAQVAAARRLPFLAVRVIVDTAHDEVPGALVETADAEGRIGARRLLLAILSDSAGIGALLRLSRRYRSARRSLRTVARGVARSAREER